MVCWILWAQSSLFHEKVTFRHICAWCCWEAACFTMITFPHMHLCIILHSTSPLAPPALSQGVISGNYLVSRRKSLIKPPPNWEPFLFADKIMQWKSPLCLFNNWKSRPMRMQQRVQGHSRCPPLGGDLFRPAEGETGKTNSDWWLWVDVEAQKKGILLLKIVIEQKQILFAKFWPKSQSLHQLSAEIKDVCNSLADALLIVSATKKVMTAALLFWPCNAKLLSSCNAW